MSNWHPLTSFCNSAERQGYIRRMQYAKIFFGFKLVIKMQRFFMYESINRYLERNQSHTKKSQGSFEEFTTTRNEFKKKMYNMCMQMRTNNSSQFDYIPLN